MKAANRQQKGPEDQEKINVALLDALLDRKGRELVTALLDQGADPNCFAAPSEYEETEKTTPLALAVSVGCVTAVPLLLARGANPRGVTLSGSEIIDAAVIKGDWRIADAILKADKDLVKLVGDTDSLHDENHLHRAIFALYPYSVIQDGVWESEEMQNTLIDYWDDIKPVEIPNRPLTVSYFGNTDMATVLLNHQEKMMFMKTQEGFSPWDVVFNPRAYQQYFVDVSGHNTIRCLTGANDPNPNVLTFQIDLCDRHGAKRFSIADLDYGINRPLVTVIFDFTRLQNLFKRYVEQSLDLQVLAQAQQHSHQIHGMKQQLRLVDEHVLAPREEKQQFEAWLKQPGHENLEIFHRVLDTRFEALILSFKVLSTNMLQANLNDKHLGALRDVLGGLQALVNVAPMVPGAVAGAMLFKRGVDKIAETRQKNVAFCVASFGDLDKMAEVRRRLTLRLTEVYARQLLALADPKTAELKQGPLQKKLRESKKTLLKSPFVSPAQQAAMFVMLWIVDQLHEAPKIEEEVRARGLEQVLFELIVQKKPPEKLKTFWIQEFIKKALGSGLLTKTGTVLEPQDFFTLPAMAEECLAGTTSGSANYSSGQSTNSPDGSPDHKAVPAPSNTTPAYHAARLASKPLYEPIVARGELVATLPKVQQGKR